MSGSEGSEEDKKTCRQCGFGPYTPSFAFDFYQDDVAGPGTGLCESCMMSNEFKPKDPVAVTDEHLKSLCKIKCGASTCRFLIMSAEGFKCAKGSGLHQTIEAGVETMTAKGDNCGGPPDFKKM